MKFFDYVKDTIISYSLENIKPLSHCAETKILLRVENKKNNPYIELAEKFKNYEKGFKEDTGDYLFYQYLKTLNSDNIYYFPLKNGEYIEAQVDLFNPFDSEINDLINPQWHLLVAHYAYIDAAFNHMDNKYANQIKDKNGWSNRKPVIKNFSRNKVLLMWMKEAKQDI